MSALRTPDERFTNLPDYPFIPHYVTLTRSGPEPLRMHYVDEGPRDAPETVLMLHGEPTWSYLYRHMIPVVAGAGYRVIAPDLIGFGKSDKPTETAAYSYQSHIDWLTEFIEQLDLERITLVCQDWGGLLGLRLAGEAEATDKQSRFARITASNTALPTGDQTPSPAFMQWREFSRVIPELPVGMIVSGGCVQKMPPAVVAAYDAPFPDEAYKTAARLFPLLVPITPTDPAATANRAAWQGLMQFNKPFLTAFSDHDPITAGGDALLQRLVPGTQGQPHTTLLNGGHFVQEDKGIDWAELIVRFMAANPVA